MAEFNTRIHRFRDKVAFHIGKGDTIYLSADDAKDFATNLNTYATDIEECTFQDSQLGTVEDLFDLDIG